MNCFPDFRIKILHDKQFEIIFLSITIYSDSEQLTSEWNTSEQWAGTFDSKRLTCKWNKTIFREFVILEQIII